MSNILLKPSNAGDIVFLWRGKLIKTQAILKNNLKHPLKQDEFRKKQQLQKGFEERKSLKFLISKILNTGELKPYIGSFIG